MVYSASLYPAPALVIATPNATVRSAFNPPPLPPVNEIFAYCPFPYPEPLARTVSPILSKTKSTFLANLTSPGFISTILPDSFVNAIPTLPPVRGFANIPGGLTLEYDDVNLIDGLISVPS